MKLAAGSTAYIRFTAHDPDTGTLQNADSTPTLTVYRNGAVDGAVSVTLANPATGSYTASFTVGVWTADSVIQLVASLVVAGKSDVCTVGEFTVDATITAIKAKTDLIATNSADSPNAMTAQTNAASAATTATTIATILSGITSLPKWLRALFRKSTPDATALGEINSGGGTYDATTDSQEAMAEAIAAVDATAGSAPTATEIWTHAQRSLTDGAIRVVSPFQSGSFAIVRGDSYLNADGNARSFGKVDGATWPTDLTGWTITFTCNPTDDLLAADPDAVGFSATGTVVTATGDSQAVRIDFTAAQTATLSVEDGGYKYDVQASSGSSRATLETGYMAVLEDQTTG